MPSTVEQLNPTRVKLVIEVPFADLKPHLDKAYKEIAGQVTIPGFRKGKVPAAVIDQRFGRGAVLQEAINEALPGAYGQAIQEHEVTPLGQPDIEMTKLEDGDVVEFTAEVDIRPEFELPSFDEIEVAVDNVEASEDTVSERVELLRRRFATQTDVDRKAKKGDLLTISLTATQGGKELEDASATDITYEVGDDANMLEGLADAVTGLKAGESKVFKSTLLGGPNRDEEADIEVTVSKVQEQELPEVDDEFAQMVSEFDTVDEMKADLRKAVEEQARQEQIAQARDRVVEAVVAATTFELPAGVLETEQGNRRQQVERQLANAGLTLKAYLESAEDEEAETEEEFWEQLEARGEEALRAQLILDQFAEENTVDVSQQDLTELIFQKAQMNGTSPQDEIQHMMEHNHMAEWMGEVRRGKALAQICSLATVKDADGNAVEMPQPSAEEEAPEEVDDVEVTQVVTEGDEDSPEIVTEIDDEK